MDAIRRDDPELAAELEGLLSEHDRSIPIRIEAALGPDADGTLGCADHSGRRIGPYRLVRILGRGGMGQVYLAERIDGQFEHQVALKLMNRSIPDSESRNRFLAERQILARLDHPNIARLLDGGVAEDGSPYLVMERVRGLPITEYCDQHALGIRERLDLFIQVCLAVEAAHNRLVVHRDLKPSNILVDADGRVRLLDFGIAKLLDPQYGDLTPQTRTGMYLLTPEYASPEQVSGATLTTASDVYSLGLLLYVLLTGVSAQPVDDPSPVGIHRAVCERRPLTPSQAVLADGPPTPPERSLVRGRLSPTRLARRLEGDLDTIVEMSIRKEPERRYRSAVEIADDIKRHLARRPVNARPDTLGYRASRFVSRHRAAVLAGATVLLSLSGSLTAALYGLNQARAAERRAAAEAASSRRLADFMVGLFSSADPTTAQSQVITARSLLDRGAERIEHELANRTGPTNDITVAIGQAYYQLGEYEQSIRILTNALELLPPDDAKLRAEVLMHLSIPLMRSGDFDGSVKAARDAVECVETLTDADPALRAEASSILGQRLFEVRRAAEAVEPLRRAVAFHRMSASPSWRQMALDIEFLGHAVFDTEDQDAGLELLNESAAILASKVGDPAAEANGRTRLALRQIAAGRIDEAELNLRRALDRATAAAVNGHHEEIQDAELALATLAETRGDQYAAADHLAAAFEQSVAVWGRDHPKVAMVRLRRGKLLLEMGRFDEAIEELRQGRETLAERFSGHAAHLAAFDLPLARALAARGRIDEAAEIAGRVAAMTDTRYAASAAELLSSLDGSSR